MNKKMEENQEELKRQLSVLIENELYYRIVAIRDEKFPNEAEMIEEIIQSYIVSLPSHMKQIPHLYSYIKNKLLSMDEMNKQIKKMRKEHDRNVQKNLER